MQTNPGNQDLLTDFEAELYQASGNLRFINWLLDRCLFWGISWCFNLFWANFMRSAMADEEYWVRYSVNLCVSFFLYGLTMGGIEALFRGKSLGKFVTGTRAVNWDGTVISPQKAFLRGLCRMVPLEAFSALANRPPFPWHDRWTRTCVIEEKKSVIIE